MEENNQLPLASDTSQSVPVAPLNPQDSTSPKPKSKLLLIVIGIVIFLLIAGSAAGFYVFKQQGLKTASKPTPSPIVQELIPSPISDPTANWKTYNNSRSGYAGNPNYLLKYPSSWTENDEHPGMLGYDNCFFSNDFKGEGSDGIGSAYFRIESGAIFCTHPIPSSETFTDKLYLSKICNESGNIKGSGEAVTCNSETIGNIKVFREEETYFATMKDYNDSNKLYTQTIATITDGENSVVFRFIHKSNKNNKILIDQILSTFKFNQNENTDLTITLPTNWYFKENSTQKIFIVDENGGNNVTFTKCQTQNLEEMIQIAKKGIVRDLTLFKHIIDGIEVTEYTGCINPETCDNTSNTVLPIKDAYYIIHSPDPDRAVLEKILAGVQIKS